jgi:PAS domain-containing protein
MIPSDVRATPAVAAALEILLRSPAAVAVVTRASHLASSRIVTANRAMGELLHTSVRELVGRPALSLVAARALALGRDRSFTELATRGVEHGILRRVVVSIAPLRDGTDEPSHCVVILREVRGDRAAFEFECA